MYERKIKPRGPGISHVCLFLLKNSDFDQMGLTTVPHQLFFLMSVPLFCTHLSVSLCFVGVSLPGSTAKILSVLHNLAETPSL